MGPDRRELAAVFAGGVVGALLRAELAETLPHGAGSWPWTTFAINVSGTFLLGLLVTRLRERVPPSDYLRPLLGTGFCGAFTTFSTFQLEVVDLADGGHAALAAGYAAASVATGAVAVWLATHLARRTRALA
jgi:CrcB protein